MFILKNIYFRVIREPCRLITIYVVIDILSYNRSGDSERLSRMQEIGVRSPIATDLIR